VEHQGPRLFGIPAADAPVVGVIRRGPSAWCHVGRWDVARGTYEPGAWLKGTLYPQRCDVSPDGRWFSYVTLHAGAAWDLGWTYVGISRLPWLHALAAWGTAGTWTRGIHFSRDESARPAGEPDRGSLPYDVIGAGIAVTPPASFAVERRRGWTEAAGSPPRDVADRWDERRAQSLRMTKPRRRTIDRSRRRPVGRLVHRRQASRRHRGQLEVRGQAGWLAPDVTIADLAQETPAPAEAPEWAQSWTPTDDFCSARSSYP
jgi:hypothetical protein